MGSYFHTYTHCTLVLLPIENEELRHNLSVALVAMEVRSKHGVWKERAGYHVTTRIQKRIGPQIQFFLFTHPRPCCVELVIRLISTVEILRFQNDKLTHYCQHSLSNVVHSTSEWWL